MTTSQAMENSQHSATEEELLSRDQIVDRYHEICEVLTVTPPKFLIKAADEIKSDGLHLPHGDGTFSIYLSDEVRSSGGVDAIIIHELSHHVLLLAGYSSPGHAWVMLATEQILFKKAGVDFDSIIWDAQNNWPRHIFWSVWLKHVQYAFEVIGQPAVESEMLSKPAVDIAAWVLQQHAPFEGVFGRHWFWKKPLEMYHTIISDLRSVRIFARWTICALFSIGIALIAIADQIGSAWLKNATAVVLSGALFVIIIAMGLTQIYNQIVASAKNLWRTVVRIKAVFSNYSRP